ncbi:hypothetical protein SARC_05817 [Sphaeroforma arctica JP610]|uniref:GDP-fucose protein O-fucosyltransferase 1 n=1 Tax=Sphaeroforma arctica JP610 TaxID=667725 RepID=A0A0L0FZ90_9EUKA|nr:hypothetical protein SARC_05817 [Sphaeroforma arctica JP610]KNC81886.1 hypothetical protein SARC_05817 [Sphaeroforma arctica JP610]|eukprot:XP_014155788.1 hypothetical protein SARC_05817 [Sphaeroforma arctica JP610]
MKSYYLLSVLAASFAIASGERLESNEAHMEGEVVLEADGVQKPLAVQVEQAEEQAIGDADHKQKMLKEHLIKGQKDAKAEHDDFIEEDGWDRRGYHMWSNQKGKFTQQIAHAMGMIGTTAKLGRNVVLPAFSIHDQSVQQTRLLKFNDVFDMTSLKMFDPRFITLEDFMEKFGETRWPVDERYAYCDEEWPLYEKSQNCNLKTTPKAAQYWDAYSIDFIGKKPFSRKTRPVPESDPVFVTGSLARYPLETRLDSLYGYFRWNPYLLEASIDYVEKYLPRPFMSVQIAGGKSWATTCEAAVSGADRILASRQCLGENEKIYAGLCKPSEYKMLTDIVDVAIKEKVKSIFLIADAITEPFIPNLQKMLAKQEMSGVIVIAGTGNEVLDVVIEELSDVFLGNCVNPASEIIMNFRKHHIPEDVRPPTYYFGKIEE